MEYINKRIIQRMINNNDGNKQKFLTGYNITEADLRDFKFPGYNVRELKKSVNDFVSQKQDSSVLKYNNDPDGGGRHIAPHNVNISSVIALNLVCDIIEGSYQINLEQSNQAQQGYILYSFAPTAPPGFLITEDPNNPVYMRCHNKSLTRINFRLTDQSNNLIDLRGEVLAISLFVKS